VSTPVEEPVAAAARQPVGSLEESTCRSREAWRQEAKNYFSGRNAQTLAEWELFLDEGHKTTMRDKCATCCEWKRGGIDGDDGK
jgi:hypothetical protein